MKCIKNCGNDALVGSNYCVECLPEEDKYVLRAFDNTSSEREMDVSFETAEECEDDNIDDDIDTDTDEKR